MYKGWFLQNISCNSHVRYDNKQLDATMDMKNWIKYSLSCPYQ
jgi:hypothetical protein